MSEQRRPPTRTKLSASSRRVWPTQTGAPTHNLTLSGEHTVAIVGDWESHRAHIKTTLDVINREAPSTRTILHLGDLRFAAPSAGSGAHLQFSPRFLPWLDEQLHERNIERLLLTPGNHEWWEQLHQEFSRHPNRPYRVSRKIWILPRGFEFMIADTTFLSFGGAASLDQGPGSSRWSEHEVASADEAAAVQPIQHINVLLLHEAVNAGIAQIDAIINGGTRWPSERLRASEESRELVTALRARLRPDLTFHGHMHVAGSHISAADGDVHALARAPLAGSIALLDTRKHGVQIVRG
ncbi:calcineurin-like phosphoesterase family protein [Curtobacterium sp. PhB142]|uniref:metallophosphoesterase n=1 Tax=unclassified Curtobacterium TaxID=257496 RepID=UPI0010DF6E9B|nr:MULTISPECIES: metallophosphoesterase [unclassified Curtobacterium]TCL83493.1 calcineurin-like phosphoesterase family protein [Curtobacterium sp. PhB142]TCM01014.1 calcineurin-like phosphoesterase family protein [Curtobacterium sp. PhB134]